MEIGVVTGVESNYCKAVHLLAHSKGDSVCHSFSQFCPSSPSLWRQYIANYTQRRSRDPARCDVVREVDSVRNGLFLWDILHIGLSLNEVAFLMVRAAYMMWSCQILTP